MAVLIAVLIAAVLALTVALVASTSGSEDGSQVRIAPSAPIPPSPTERNQPPGLNGPGMRR